MQTSNIYSQANESEKELLLEKNLKILLKTDRVFYFNQTESTFLVEALAKARQTEVRVGDIYLAGSQTAGLGTKGKWSHKQKNLAVTIVLESPKTETENNILRLVINLAVMRAINEQLGVSAKVNFKYPNDLRVSSNSCEQWKKISGIMNINSYETNSLARTRQAFPEDKFPDFSKLMLIGIGINIPRILDAETMLVTNYQGQETIEQKNKFATSIEEISGKDIPNYKILKSILKHLEILKELSLSDEELFFDLVTKNQITDSGKVIVYLADNTKTIINDALTKFTKEGVVFKNQGLVPYQRILRITAEQLGC